VTPIVFIAKTPACLAFAIFGRYVRTGRYANTRSGGSAWVGAVLMAESEASADVGQRHDREAQQSEHALRARGADRDHH
jgi:hypothetical protein